MREGGLDAVDYATARVKEIQLKNVPVLTVMQYLCDCSKLRYKVDHTGVVILALGSGLSEDLIRRKWQVDPVLMLWFRKAMEDPEAGGPDPFGGEPAKRIESIDRPLVDLLKECGIDFPSGATADYDQEAAAFRAKNTPANLELIERILGSLAMEVSRERALGGK